MGQGKKEERKGKQNGVKEGDDEEEGVMDEQRRWNRKEGKKKRKAAKSQEEVVKEKNRKVAIKGNAMHKMSRWADFSMLSLFLKTAIMAMIAKTKLTGLL